MIGKDVDGNDIKAGDMVKKVDGRTFSNGESVVKVGCIYLECDQVRICIETLGTNIPCSRVYKVKTNRHPHADLIIQWAEDTSLVIEHYNGLGWFSTLGTPQWLSGTKCRIKLSKTPAELEKESILASIKELEENTATALSELQSKLEGLEV